MSGKQIVLKALRFGLKREVFKVRTSIFAHLLFDINLIFDNQIHIFVNKNLTNFDHEGRVFGR